MKKLLLLITLCTTILLYSCTDNSRARKWGGTENVTLLPNEKLVNLTWKETQLWVLTLDTTTNTYYFREKSQFGVLQGTVIVK
jgi:hypothetical protein